MKGYRLTHGIWNRNHSITSRDVANPEVHFSRKDAEMSLFEKRRDYEEMGYEIWFSNIDEVEAKTVQNVAE